MASASLEMLAHMARASGGLPRRPPPSTNLPKIVEREYLRDLRDMLQAAHGSVKSKLFPEIEAIAQEARDSLVTDTWVDDAQRLIEQAKREWADVFGARKLQQVAERAAGRVNDRNRSKVRRQMRALVGVDVLRSDPDLAPEVQKFTAENVSLISGVSDRYFDEVQNAVLRNAGTGLRASELESEIHDRFRVAKSRAAFIARDQTNKFNGSLTEARHASLGITEYIWHTSEDELVRPGHANLNGTPQSYDSPPIVDPKTGRRAHPGGDYLCRCTAEPVIPGITPEVLPPTRGATKNPRRLRVEGRGKLPRKPDRRPTAPLRGGREVELTARQVDADQNARWIRGSRAALHASREEERRDWLLWEWVHGTERRASRLLRQAAVAELGAVGPTSRGGAKVLAAAGDLSIVRKSVRQLYRKTQSELRRRGTKKLKLYRGEKNRGGRVGRRRELAVASWTSDRRVAERFAGRRGVVREIEVDAKDVLAGHTTPGWVDGKHGPQSEYLVLSTKGR